MKPFVDGCWFGNQLASIVIQVSLTIDELGLGSLATLRDFEMVYDSELGNFEVSAETTLDFADNPNDFAVFGNIQSNGDFELGVSLRRGTSSSRVGV